MEKTRKSLLSCPRAKSWLLAAVGLVIYLFSLIFLPNPIFAQPEGLPISSIAASSSALDYPPSKAIDQDLSSFWQGQTAKKTWFLNLDLSKPSFLNKLSIYWNKDSGAANYSLQGSNDGRRWKNLLLNLSSLGGSTNPHLKEHSLTGTYRYLRLFIRKAQKGSPIIYELKVFGQAQAPSPADTTPPTGSIQINSNQAYTNSLSVTLRLSARDNPGGSGLSQMQFSNDNSSWSTPEAYAATRTWSLALGDGQKAVYVKYKDGAGNWSLAYSDTIILDTIVPQIISVTPPDGSIFYESDTIVISSTVKDTDPSPLEYQFSLDGIIKQVWSGLSNYSWLSSSQDRGSHNIKVEVRDVGGQESKQAEIYILRRPIAPPA